jgi:hypothetical protein
LALGAGKYAGLALALASHLLFDLGAATLQGVCGAPSGVCGV